MSLTSPVATTSVDRYLARRRNNLLLVSVTALLTVASVIADVSIGPGGFSLSDVMQAIVSPETASPIVSVVVWDIRLPIALMAMLVGMSLASAGAEMQTILNNPLADPFTLGVSAAASFGAALAIVLGVGLVPGAEDLLTTLNAFLMAMLASLLIWLVSRLRGVSVQVMVLMGIALMFFFNAMLGVLQYLASAQSLQQLVFWSLGSLTRASWSNVAIVAATLVITLPVFLLAGWKLTALRMGDLQARAMGINVPRLRLVILVCASLLTATAVAFVGTIGFVGLVGPHIARLLVGEDHRIFLPMSALTGALLMSLTSIASKTIMPGVLLPIGILTALIGLPFFISLVLRSRREMWG